MSDMSERAKAKILNMNEAVREDAEVAEDDCAISSSSCMPCLVYLLQI